METFWLLLYQLLEVVLGLCYGAYIVSWLGYNMGWDMEKWAKYLIPVITKGDVEYFNAYIYYISRKRNNIEDKDR